ncbi:hypothetical protein DEU56DRAFT_916126 [Suillus clintonianus]|uniref:uncharacterized protein n=1 Tax=Suillus clintonianus TaxID=1904413 RepID=UPI001B8840BC|nr:uncharacterized protein DEU56DRAFT_916126 [Suillus clintonianus]KAG2126208.1 hypothetical protein DEU56DRAFT_916126 [Suillus clintonianus]
MRSRLLSVVSGSSPLETFVQLSSAAIIIFEHSFYIFDKRRHLQDQQNSVSSHIEALERHMASPHAASVREAVSAAVHKYQEAVSTVEKTSSTWKGKLPFERSRRKAELLSPAKTLMVSNTLPRR